MINSNYKTIYCKNHNNTYADMIETIAFSTEMQYVKWQRKYDYQANLYYWYGEDKEYNEKYYFYIDNPVCGTLLQIVSDKEERNFELDDMTFPEELKKLANMVMGKKKSTALTCGYNGYSNFYDNYYDSYYNKSYKSYKREKADKQLKDVEPMRNFETL